MKILGFAVLLLLLFPGVILAWNGQNMASGIPRSNSHLNAFAERYNNGFFSLTEINMAFGLNAVHAPYSEHFFGATTAAGYQFNHAMFAGVGAGILDYNNGVMVPVFLHGRYYFRSLRFSPFITGDGGMLLHLSGADTKSRMYFNPGIGVVISSTRTAEFTVAASLFSQWEKDVRRDSFLNLKIGLSFF